MAIASVRTAEAGGGLEEAAALGLDRDALLRILHSLRAHAAARRARARALQAGQAARVVLHLQGERGGLRRRRGGHGARGRGGAAAPQPRPAPLPRRRAVARALPVHGPRRRDDQRPRLQPAHPGRDARHRHLRGAVAPALDPAGRRRRRARVPRARRAARGARLARRRLVGPRHGARVDELRRRAAPPGRVRDRQQPVRLLHADATSTSPPPRWPRAGPPTGSRASSSTAPTCSPSTARRVRRSSARARAAGRPRSS